MSRNTPDSSKDEKSRDQILDRAIKVFSEKGFGGASLREIADQAGVSHSMVKYYFGGKEALWRAAVEFLFERQTRERGPALEAAKNKGAEALLKVVIAETIRYSARHPEHARLVMQASMRPGPHLDWILKHVKGLHQAHYANFEAPPGGVIDASTAVALHYFIYGALQSVFTLEHEAKGLYGIDVTTEEFINGFIQLATSLLVPAVFAVGGSSYANLQAMQPTLETHKTSEGIELRIKIPESFTNGRTPTQDGSKPKIT